MRVYTFCGVPTLDTFVDFNIPLTNFKPKDVIIYTKIKKAYIFEDFGLAYPYNLVKKNRINQEIYKKVREFKDYLIIEEN